MANAKSYSERIEFLQKRQEELKNKEKILKKRKRDEDKKAHDKILMEFGKIVEFCIRRKATKGDIILFKAFLSRQELNGKYFSKAMNVSTNDRD